MTHENQQKLARLQQEIQVMDDFLAFLDSKQTDSEQSVLLQKNSEDTSL